MVTLDTERLTGRRRLLHVTEPIAVWLVIVALIGLQLSVVRGWALFSHRFWFDEWCTWLAADAPTPSAMWRLYVATEANPPLYPLLAWLTSRLSGGATELGLRTLSFACTTLAMAWLYLVVARVGSRGAAAAAVALMWSLPAVQFHAFDARYYPAWLACTVGFGWCVHEAVVGARPTAWPLAIGSVLLYGVYLLGPLTWGLALLGGLVTREGTWRRRARRLAPALAGPVLVGPFLAWVVVSLASAFEAVSWTEPFSVC
jgi:hypothetical protein